MEVDVNKLEKLREGPLGPKYRKVFDCFDFKVMFFYEPENKVNKKSYLVKDYMFSENAIEILEDSLVEAGISLKHGSDEMAKMFVLVLYSGHLFAVRNKVTKRLDSIFQLGWDVMR